MATDAPAKPGAGEKAAGAVASAESGKTPGGEVTDTDSASVNAEKAAANDPRFSGVSTKSNPQVILIKRPPEAGAGPTASPSRSEGTVPGQALSREAAKQRQTRIRRLEKQEAEILKELAALEAEKKSLEAEISRPEVYRNGEKAKAAQARLNETTAAAEAKTQEWEAKAEELEKANRE
jgi:ATP-binding cassette subfamily F protein 3